MALSSARETTHDVELVRLAVMLAVTAHSCRQPLMLIVQGIARQLAGYAFLSSVLLHSSLRADDAGRLAARLPGGSVALRLCCGCCAWSFQRQKCVDVCPMWSLGINEKLHKATRRPTLHVFIASVCHKVLPKMCASVVPARPQCRRALMQQ